MSMRVRQIHSKAISVTEKLKQSEAKLHSECACGCCDLEYSRRSVHLIISFVVSWLCALCMPQWYRSGAALTLTSLLGVWPCVRWRDCIAMANTLPLDALVVSRELVHITVAVHSFTVAVTGRASGGRKSIRNVTREDMEGEWQVATNRLRNTATFQRCSSS